MKPLVIDINDFFPTTHKILVEVDSNLEQSFTTRIPHGTPNSVIEAVMTMCEYCLPNNRSGKFYFPNLLLSFLALMVLLIWLFVRIVAGMHNLMRQRDHIFQKLKALKNVRAYVAQSAYKQQELHVELETAQTATTVKAQKETEDGANMLWKTELANERL